LVVPGKSPDESNASPLNVVPGAGGGARRTIRLQSQKNLPTEGVDYSGAFTLKEKLQYLSSNTDQEAAQSVQDKKSNEDLRFYDSAN
jgi:hypothetical protein